MHSLKKASIEVLKSLPDSSSLEDIMYELNMTAQVLEGLSDEEKGKTISTADLLKRVKNGNASKVVRKSLLSSPTYLRLYRFRLSLLRRAIHNQIDQFC